MKSKVYRLKDGGSLVVEFEYILLLGEIRLYFDCTGIIVMSHSKNAPPRDSYLRVV